MVNDMKESSKMAICMVKVRKVILFIDSNIVHYFNRQVILQ